MKLRFEDLTPLCRDLPEYDGHLVRGLVDENDRPIVGEFIHRVGGIDTLKGPKATCLGGIRWRRDCGKETDISAFTDGLRLSRGMSKKAAGVNLHIGGAKTVVFGHNIPGGKADEKGITTWSQSTRHAVWRAFMESAYHPGHVLAEDSGTGASDMQAIGGYAKLLGKPVIVSGDSNSTDPSPFTAQGIMIGIEATVDAFNNYEHAPLSEMSFMVQGVGSVGAGIVNALWEAGCRDIIITDINKKQCEKVRCKREISYVPPDQALLQNTHVFVPCAFGGILNERSIEAMEYMMIAGCANNLLATPEDGVRLHKKRILYAPDYIINAGGLIKVWSDVVGGDVDTMLLQIGATLRLIYAESRDRDLAPSEVADAMAAERMKTLMYHPEM